MLPTTMHANGASNTKDGIFSALSSKREKAKACYGAAFEAFGSADKTLAGVSVSKFETNVFLFCGGLMVSGYWISRFWISGSKSLEDADAEYSEAATRLSLVSGLVEQCGLWSLLWKISRDKSVAGLSGRTMLVYLCEYVMRFLVTFEFSLATGWKDRVFVLMYILAVALVLRVLYCIFRKHRESYEADHDTFPAQFQILACVLMPILLQADVQMGPLRNYMWNTCMYLEMTALLAQVHMIAKAQAPVDALISHFVAATATSRFVDLFYWYFAFSFVAPDGLNFSICLILFCHVMHAMLLGDFMYYYLKFRISGVGGLLSEMPIPEI